MRVAVLTDIHANLPALKAVLGALKQEGYDTLIHLGDVIAVGPFPSECLDLLLNLHDARFIMGNHDGYFAEGIPESYAIGSVEYEHQYWTHGQIDPDLRKIVAEWRCHLRLDLDGVEVTFLHYPLDQSGLAFLPIATNLTPSALDELFLRTQSNLTPFNFYGHDHRFSDVTGKSRYVNPGSLGCSVHPVARYTIIQSQNGVCEIDHRAVDYDDQELFEAFESRRVPGRSTIYRGFFGGRFGG
jgi:predicted phosphodiesterase